MLNIHIQLGEILYVFYEGVLSRVSKKQLRILDSSIIVPQLLKVASLLYGLHN